jgi:hypothetical protein
MLIGELALWFELVEVTLIAAEFEQLTKGCSFNLVVCEVDTRNLHKSVGGVVIFRSLAGQVPKGSLWRIYVSTTKALEVQRKWRRQH